MNRREAGSDHGHPRRLLGGSWPRPVAAEGQASLSCPALSPREPFHYFFNHFKFFSLTAGHLPPATGPWGCMCPEGASLSPVHAKAQPRLLPESQGKTGTHQKEPMRPKASDEKRRRMLDEKKRKTFVL